MLLAIFGLLTFLAPAQQTSLEGRGFHFQSFQPLPGFRATAINDNGDIAGNHPFHGAVLVRRDGSIHFLGFDGRVMGLNNRGQMLVYGDNQIFLRQPDGRMEPRILAGAKQVVGYGLNNFGEIAGEADFRPVVWDRAGIGKVIPTGSCRLSNISPPRNAALAINDSGEIVVQIECESNYLVGFGAAKYGAMAAGLSNNGDVFVSAAQFVRGRSTTLWNADGRVIYYAYGDWSTFNEKKDNEDHISFLAISPNGRLLVGTDFVAESCPVVLRPRAMPIPNVGGAVAVDATAGEGCKWYAEGHFIGSASISVPGRYGFEVPPKVTAAGVNIPVPPGGVCQYKVSGVPALFAAEGEDFQAAVETAAGCPWIVGVHPGLTAEPMAGTGPGAVRVRVPANATYTPMSFQFSVAGLVQRAGQAGQPCTIDAIAPNSLGAGSGIANLQVSAPAECRWRISSPAEWIHLSRVSFDPLFRFDPNPTAVPRTAVLTLATGTTVTITQEAATEGVPLVVEPMETVGPTGVLRFTFAGEPAATQIRIGDDCMLRYERDSASWLSGGSACTWDSPIAETADGVFTITAAVTFAARGQFAIVADGRQLGIFTASDASPTEPAPFEPLPGAGWLPPAQIQIRPFAGVGGLFRLTVSSRYPKAILGLTQGCWLTVESATGRMSTGRPDYPNTSCVMDIAKAKLTRADGKYIVDLPVEFRSTVAGPSASGATFPAPDGSYAGSYSMGEFTVLPSVAPPSAYFLPDLLRVGFPGKSAIEQARVVVGGCTVVYVREPESFHAEGCELADAFARQVGHDLILGLRFRGPVSGVLSAEQTPRDGIASGLFRLATVSR